MTKDGVMEIAFKTPDCGHGDLSTMYKVTCYQCAAKELAQQMLEMEQLAEDYLENSDHDEFCGCELCDSWKKRYNFSMKG